MGRMVYFTDTDPFAPSYGSLQGFFYQPTNGDGSRRSVFSNRKGVLSDPICVGRFPTLVVDVAELAPSHSFSVIFFGVRLGAPLAPPPEWGGGHSWTTCVIQRDRIFFRHHCVPPMCFAARCFPTSPSLSFTPLPRSPQWVGAGRVVRDPNPNPTIKVGSTLPWPCLPAPPPPPDQNHRVYPDLHAVVG